MNPEDTISCWYESWFDSKYYHLLYSNRDNTEAEEFIGRLVHFLSPQPGARALDLACGKGRHSIALHKKGLDVTGIDLSGQSIAAAKENDTEGLVFFVHDMRQPFMVNYFDFTFNLFTSFGYFASVRENEKVVKAVKSGLKQEGTFVIDFLNAGLVRKMVAVNNSGVMKVADIEFHWKKRIENNVVLKDISFEAENKQYHFTESVQLLSLADFEKLLAPYFTIEHIFGDYHLGKYDAETSPRLILLAKKNKV
ncbi:MAG: methyltransferase domain-containing protein [Bacteroidia bacterium]